MHNYRLQATRKSGAKILPLFGYWWAAFAGA